jgi:hypothetical protein
MKTEAKIQQEIVMYFKNEFCRVGCNPRCIIFSVPNESNSKRETMQKMAIGMMPGVSDLIVIFPDRVIFIEIKTPEGRQSPSQKDFQATVSDLGFEYFVVRSLEQFKTKISCYQTFQP